MWRLRGGRSCRGRRRERDSGLSLSKIRVWEGKECDEVITKQNTIRSHSMTSTRMEFAQSKT